MPQARLTQHPAEARRITPALRVLLVVDDPQRRQLLQSCLEENLPGCSLEVVDSYFDAMTRATRMQARLLILDLSLDSVLVPALKRFLARAAPQVQVHVFDESLDGAARLEALSHADRPSIVRLKQACDVLTSDPTPSH